MDDNGQSPLWIAAYECNREIVGMLLSVKRTYTNQTSTDRDYKGYTPIDIATKNPKSKNGCGEVVGQLRKAGAAPYVYPSGPKANLAVPDGVGKRLYATTGQFEYKKYRSRSFCIIAAVTTIVVNICAEKMLYTLRMKPKRLSRVVKSLVVRASYGTSLLGPDDAPNGPTLGCGC